MRPLLSQIMHICPKLVTVLLLWWGGKNINTTVSFCLHFCKGSVIVRAWFYEMGLAGSTTCCLVCLPCCPLALRWYLLPIPTPSTQSHRQGCPCQAHFRHLLKSGHDTAGLAEASGRCPLPCRHKGVISNTQWSQCLRLLTVAILDHFLQPNNGHRAPDAFFIYSISRKDLAHQSDAHYHVDHPCPAMLIKSLQ